MKILSLYSKKIPRRQRDPGISMTQQSLANEADINLIMAKARKTGQMPLPMSDRQAQYRDFTNVESYQDAQNYIILANEEFMKLPASIRTYFDNDPNNLIAFIQDPDNEEESIKIGLTKADKPPQPDGIEPSGDPSTNNVVDPIKKSESSTENPTS